MSTNPAETWVRASAALPVRKYWYGDWAKARPAPERKTRLRILKNVAGANRIPVLLRQAKNLRCNLLKCRVHGIRVSGAKCLALHPGGERNRAGRIVGDHLQQRHIGCLAAGRAVIESDGEDYRLAQIRCWIGNIHLSGLTPDLLVPDLPSLMGRGLPRREADLATVRRFRRVIRRAAALIAPQV